MWDFDAKYFMLTWVNLFDVYVQNANGRETETNKTNKNENIVLLAHITRI